MGFIIALLFVVAVLAVVVVLTKWIDNDADSRDSV